MPQILSKEFTIGKLYFINEFETRALIYEIFYQSSYLLNCLTLKPGSIIIDVGAHIGLFSLFALRQCEYDALIYSFEPIPATFECLKRNLAQFKDQTRLYNMGISDVSEECSVEFTLFGRDTTTATYKPGDKFISNYNPLLNYETLLKISKVRDKLLYYQLKFLPFMRNYLIKRNFKKRTAEKKVQCTLTSLGHFIEKNGINHIDFIKIDVEGAEFEVVKSIKPSQFSMIKQLCIEVHNIDNRVEHLATYLQEQGYLTEIHRNSIYERLGYNQHMIYAKRPS
ncbi:FkbM family methyltransferase [Legionella maioricensis]|uniref:FkbM family methyltransferase n=1 Tax=Legionella maioricensis TaxID=2896528 RepID=A0A9X2I8Z0_9GAMM|nr:FkbM family methyltransferase [Legionella maioricensis]MCL9682476.1 FkbM family methyltransferase [Legionella maioricensis]MCL9686277.1 FkbM family methyltransferase [Legionella maioricensis]